MSITHASKLTPSPCSDTVLCVAYTSLIVWGFVYAFYVRPIHLSLHLNRVLEYVQWKGDLSGVNFTSFPVISLSKKFMVIATYELWQLVGV